MSDLEDTLLIAAQIFMTLILVIGVSAFLWWLHPLILAAVLVLAGISLGAALIVRWVRR